MASSAKAPRKSSRRRKYAKPGQCQFTRDPFGTGRGPGAVLLAPEARSGSPGLASQPLGGGRQATGAHSFPTEAAHGYVLDAVEARVDLAEGFADGAHVLAHVVAVAAALHHLEEIVVGDDLAAALVERGED